MLKLLYQMWSQGGKLENIKDSETFSLSWNYYKRPANPNLKTSRDALWFVDFYLNRSFYGLSTLQNERGNFLENYLKYLVNTGNTRSHEPQGKEPRLWLPVQRLKTAFLRDTRLHGEKQRPKLEGISDGAQATSSWLRCVRPCWKLPWKPPD